MIGDLEEGWGVTLLERGKGGVSLTSAGMKLLRQIHRILSEHALLLAQVDELHDCQTGLVRIGTFSSVATHWLPHMIKRFQRD